MSNVGDKAQDALAIPEQELRLVVDTIPTLVWTAAPGGNIEYVGDFGDGKVRRREEMTRLRSHHGIIPSGVLSP